MGEARRRRMDRPRLRVGAVRRRRLVRGAGRGALVQIEVRPPETPGQPPAPLRGDPLPQTLGHCQGLLTMLDDGAVGVGLRGLLRRALVVAERALPVLGTTEVECERLVVLGETVRVQLLD